MPDTPAVGTACMDAQPTLVVLPGLDGTGLLTPHCCRHWPSVACLRRCCVSIGQFDAYGKNLPPDIPIRVLRPEDR